MKKKKYYFSVRRGSNYRVYNTDGDPGKEVYFTKVEADKQARILNEKNLFFLPLVVILLAWMILAILIDNIR